MKLIILAFILSICLHFILFSQFKETKIVQESKNKVEVKKSKITYAKLKIEKKPEKKAIVKKPKRKKPIVKKKKIKKKVYTKKIKKVKKVKKIHRKKLKKSIEKAKQFQNKVIKEQIVKNQKTIQENTLEDFLSQKEPIDKKILSTIQRLYGREYQSFTKIQKAFIEKNLNSFQIITQRVLTRLGYPPIASKMRIYGTNVVEFIFHPNGSISNLKISSSSNYNVLDEYTLELIRIAYKDYPRPKTSTKLKFYVHYRLY